MNGGCKICSFFSGNFEIWNKESFGDLVQNFNPLYQLLLLIFFLCFLVAVQCGKRAANERDGTMKYTHFRMRICMQHSIYQPLEREGLQLRAGGLAANQDAAWVERRVD